jgi:hypothetical protein
VSFLDRINRIYRIRRNALRRESSAGLRPATQAVGADPCVRPGRTHRCAPTVAHKAESLHNVAQRSSTVCPQAESLESVSIGQRPMYAAHKDFKPCKGGIKGMSPLQGLVFFAPLRRALPYANGFNGFALK